MKELKTVTNVDRVIEPVTLAECIIYGGLDGRIFSYRPQQDTMFYRVMTVKRDIAVGPKLLVYENPAIERIDFDTQYSPNGELLLATHLNDRLAKEFVPEMIHKHVHIEGPGFGLGFGVIAVGRRMKGKPNPEDILRNLPGTNPKQIE